MYPQKRLSYGNKQQQMASSLKNQPRSPHSSHNPFLSSRFRQSPFEMEEDFDDDDGLFSLRSPVPTRNSPFSSSNPPSKTEIPPSTTTTPTSGTKRKTRQEETAREKKEKSGKRSCKLWGNKTPALMLSSGPSRLSIQRQQSSLSFRPSSRTSSSASVLGNRSVVGSRSDGFRNVGNSCYLAAVLQLVLSLPPLLSFLTHPGLAAKMSREAKLFHALTRLIRERKETASGAVDPSQLREVMASYTNRFSKNRQEDAHELLIDILNVLEEEYRMSEEAKHQWGGKIELDPINNFTFEVGHVLECCRCCHSNQTTEPHRDLSLPLYPPSSKETLDQSPSSPPPHSPLRSPPRSPPLLSIFSSPLSSPSPFIAATPSPFITSSPSPFMTSPNTFPCNSSRSHSLPSSTPHSPPTSPSLFSSCPSPPRVTPDDSVLHLQDLIQSFLTDEKVERTCDQCGEEAAIIHHFLRTPPSFLLLHLKRFSHASLDLQSVPEKLRVPVVFSPIISLEHHGNGGNYQSKQTSHYRLQSFISHRGTLASVGHYVCLVNNSSPPVISKPSSGGWTCFDDSKVTKVSDIAALGDENQKDAYILCYVREDQL